jgi:hypothetical protein
MEWFVQTPEDSFKGTFFHSILLVVFSPGACLSKYTLFHSEWCALGRMMFLPGALPISHIDKLISLKAKLLVPFPSYLRLPILPQTMLPMDSWIIEGGFWRGGSRGQVSQQFLIFFE